MAMRSSVVASLWNPFATDGIASPMTAWRPRATGRACLCVLEVVAVY